ncbi:hypothetical protein [Jatrophihabitans sp.]|uniref:hypothetical protein n=1 Tax=Jatrophihabitans sp. TaxID=1932789 RepID=UPI0030C70702|nr:hypothetical protein [Jatrophihabitans sp.]
MVNEPNPASLTVAQLRAALDQAHPDQVVLFVLDRDDIDQVGSPVGLSSVVFNIAVPSDPAAHRNTFTLRPLSGRE